MNRKISVGMTVTIVILVCENNSDFGRVEHETGTGGDKC